MGISSKNRLFLILCLNIIIASIAPAEPPKILRVRRVNSLIRLFFIIANNLSNPIMKKLIILIVIRYKLIIFI